MAENPIYKNPETWRRGSRASRKELGKNRHVLEEIIDLRPGSYEYEKLSRDQKKLIDWLIDNVVEGDSHMGLDPYEVSLLLAKEQLPSGMSVEAIIEYIESYKQEKRKK